jgi:hypothetical protein
MRGTRFIRLTDDLPTQFIVNAAHSASPLCPLPVKATIPALLVQTFAPLAPAFPDRNQPQST